MFGMIWTLTLCCTRALKTINVALLILHGFLAHSKKALGSIPALGGADKFFPTANWNQLVNGNLAWCEDPVMDCIPPSGPLMFGTDNEPGASMAGSELVYWVPGAVNVCWLLLMDEDNVEVKLPPYESVYDNWSNFLVCLLDTPPYDSTSLHSFLPVHSGALQRLYKNRDSSR